MRGGSQLCGPTAICVPCSDQMVQKFQPGAGAGNGQFLCPVCLAPLGPRRRALDEGTEAMRWSVAPETPREEWPVAAEHATQAAMRDRDMEKLRRLWGQLSSQEGQIVDECEGAASVAGTEGTGLEESGGKAAGDCAIAPGSVGGSHASARSSAAPAPALDAVASGSASCEPNSGAGQGRGGIVGFVEMLVGRVPRAQGARGSLGGTPVQQRPQAAGGG